MKDVSLQKMAIVVASIIGVVACFLPWVTVSIFGISKSINAVQMGGAGYLVLISFIAIGASTMLVKFKQPKLAKWQIALNVVLGAIAALVTIVNLDNASSEVGSLASFGAGIYLAIVASVAIVIICFIPSKVFLGGKAAKPVADTSKEEKDK